MDVVRVAQGVPEPNELVRVPARRQRVVILRALKDRPVSVEQREKLEATDEVKGRKF
jgi:hypothetical protein